MKMKFGLMAALLVALAIPVVALAADSNNGPSDKGSYDPCRYEQSDSNNNQGNNGGGYCCGGYNQ